VAKISEEIRRCILADHATGRFSVRDLAARHGVGKTYIANIVKDCEPVTPKLISAGIAYKAELKALVETRGELFATAVDKALDQRTEDLQFFRNAGIEIAATTIDLFREKPSITDAKTVSDVLKNLMPVTSAVNYHASAQNIQVQQNQQQAQIKKHSDFYDEA
jgi:hypothetical protein